jgi:hypothetical protein
LSFKGFLVKLKLDNPKNDQKVQFLAGLLDKEVDPSMWKGQHKKWIIRMMAELTSPPDI